MAFNSTAEYLKFLDELFEKCNLTEDIKSSLLEKVKSMYRFELEQIQSNIEERYSDPMLWIGMYIALASLCCILAMGADLLHGLRSRKLWFPCKYFSINAFSQSVIAVTMKLPMDLTAPMPGIADQVAKLGSMAFICTMMANLLPCLATMDNNQLLTNITALVVLIITLVINVCIQLQTGLVGPTSTQKSSSNLIKYLTLDDNSWGLSQVSTFTIAVVYVTFLLLLLIIHVCSSLAILKSKEIIDSKYQQGHEKASKEVQQSTGKFLTFEKLQQHVSNYLIMAESGSPQFIIACSATTTASGVICTLTTILHTVHVSRSIFSLDVEYGSDYKWSTLLILMVQLIGIVLGTIAPLSRCFATLSFKVSMKIISNHMKVFKIENYWTQKLYDWKHGSIRIPFRIHRLMVLVKNLESSILSFCIKFQEGVVVVCKMIALIPFFFMICLLYCFRCLKWLSQVFFNSLKKRNGKMEQSPYVLQLDDEREFAKRTLKGLSKSVNRLLQKGEKKQPTYLKKLIVQKSTKSFQGVKIFGSNNNHIQCSPSKVVEYRDSWSLAVVSLTTVVVTLPNIKTLPNTTKVEVDNLLRSVREGLEYITLVEENLNATDDYVSIQKAAETLWQEVDVSRKWLGIKLEDIASQVNATANLEDTTLQIVQLFSKEAKNKISNEGVGSVNGGGPIGDSKFTSICALSMSCVCETIIADNEHHMNLFDKLSSWIADIMAACLTNIPRVIAMKCHTNAIEKREACVQAAVYLLGETKEIINTLQDWNVPSMNPNDLPFIDKWHAYLSDPRLLKTQICSTSNECRG